VKVGPAVPKICSQTDRQTHAQTDRQTDRNTPLPYRGGVITYVQSDKSEDRSSYQFNLQMELDGLPSTVMPACCELDFWPFDSKI